MRYRIQTQSKHCHNLDVYLSEPVARHHSKFKALAILNDFQTFQEWREIIWLFLGPLPRLKEPSVEGDN
jgi:hypothetical protein